MLEMCLPALCADVRSKDTHRENQTDVDNPPSPLNLGGEGTQLIAWFPVSDSLLMPSLVLERTRRFVSGTPLLLERNTRRIDSFR